MPPASLAEFTVSVDGNPDSYDVSLVRGTNLPMTITFDKVCPTTSCPVDLNPECKQSIALKKLSPARGFHVHIRRPVHISLEGLEWCDCGVQERMHGESER